MRFPSRGGKHRGDPVSPTHDVGYSQDPPLARLCSQRRASVVTGVSKSGTIAPTLLQAVLPAARNSRMCVSAAPRQAGGSRARGGSPSSRATAREGTNTPGRGRLRPCARSADCGRDALTRRVGAGRAMRDAVKDARAGNPPRRRALGQGQPRRASWRHGWQELFIHFVLDVVIFTFLAMQAAPMS